MKSNGSNRGGWIRPNRRLAIYLRDRFTCIYCLKDMHDAAPFDITLDHIVPASKSDSSNASSNLVTACRSCNSSRQDKPLNRFCGPETRAHIRRNTRRSMTRYTKLANGILSGEISHTDIKY